MALEISAELDARISTLADSVQRMHAQVANWLVASSRQPKYERISGQAIADSAGTAVIELGPVPAGRRWVVHGARAGGLTWSTVASGGAVMVVQASPPIDGVLPPLINTLDAWTGLPAVSLYTRGQVVAKNGESVYIITTSGTAAQTYAAMINFVDEPLGS